MKLRRADDAVLDRGDEFLAMACGRHEAAGVVSGIRMYEVEPRSIWDAGEQHRANRRRYRVPSHVRQHWRLQRLDPAAQHAQTSSLLAVLDARIEENLHAYADAQHRAASTRSLDDRRAAVHRDKPGHARREGTDAGYDQTVGVSRRLGIRRHRDIGPDALERALRGAEIARPVVEHHDALHRGSSAPSIAVYADPVAVATESAYKSWGLDQALENALRGRNPLLPRVELDGGP